MGMRADLHIHTVLSPCADLEMSPSAIFEIAEMNDLDLIGICDHNSTRQAKLMVKYADDFGVSVLPGVELNSSEEIHCLAFFDDLKALDEMQKIIDLHLPNIKNKPEVFGDQVVADMDGKIVYFEERLLHMALSLNMEELSEYVKGLGGLFIPAHANKGSNSIISQLGFVPGDLDVDAMEIVQDGHNLLAAYPWIKSSDAHFLDAVGTQVTEFNLVDARIATIKQYLANSGEGELI